MSRRLGRDKATLPWPQPHRRDFTLLDHAIEILSTACDPVLVVGRENFSDRVAGLGPVGGISTAVHDSLTDQSIIVAVDLPFLTAEFVNYFKERCQKSDRNVIVCKIGSAFPLCLGVRTAFKDVVDDYIAAGRRSVHGLIEAGDAQTITRDELLRAGFSEAIFTNINTERDYQAALQKL
jgi:molybdopterin-guanine dinucleotide biosynthesis protein A